MRLSLSTFETGGGKPVRLWQAMALLVGAISTTPVHAISVTATDWSESLPDNITSAGDYYDATVSTATEVTVSGTASSSEAWTLAIRLKTAVPGMSVQVKRTGSGTGDSIPTGGTTPVVLTTAFQPLCSSTGNVSNIPLEYQIGNLDVSDGYGAKSIELEYQVTTTP